MENTFACWFPSNRVPFMESSATTGLVINHVNSVAAIGGCCSGATSRWMGCSTHSRLGVAAVVAITVSLNMGAAFGLARSCHHIANMIRLT